MGMEQVTKLGMGMGGNVISTSSCDVELVYVWFVVTAAGWLTHRHTDSF